ncbi:DNA polymerase II large subunit [Candidatus Woesearchaeota archaeon]|nr:DNA polymerase II large subunit [Candidatus Woesearchaeota archaeon]
MNNKLIKYRAIIDSSIKLAYDVANKARRKGFDPEEEVEIPLAKNMAERVEGLLSVVAPQVKGTRIVTRINELEKGFGGQDWRVAFALALEVAKEKFCKFKDKKEAIEIGMRAGLAYITNGVVASPLEGFTRLGIKKRRDGREYFALYFAGPIRSAGTTAICVFVALADYLRKEFGYGEYDPDEVEIKRIVTELYDFHERVTNLQYLPSEEELEFMVKNLPLQIDGEATEKYEVSNYKDLDRMETNILRNGVALVFGEGLTQKSKKFWGKFSKWCNDFDMGHWKFLDGFVKLQEKIRSKEKEKTIETKEKIKPDYGYIKDLVAGRPVLTHPLAKGGFRLRYGRCRNSGFSSQAVHPATMVIVNRFIAIGTQLKVERPGKATTLASCDSIEGPIVKLNNGDVLLLETVEDANRVSKDVDEILYLGDILINYGDFLNRAHVLVPPGYCEEWWMLESGSEKRDVSIEEAIEFCKNGKPLHPRYCFHWKETDKEKFDLLVDWLKKGSINDDKIILPYEYDVEKELKKEDPKRTLELLGVPHLFKKEHVVIEYPWCKALMFSIGYDLNKIKTDKENVLEIVNDLSNTMIRDKSGTTIGARMGRPEKAKMRKLTGSPQVLFPVGVEGGRMRCFQSALEKGKITADFPLFYCYKCNKETIFSVCHLCGNKPGKKYYSKTLGLIDNLELDKNAAGYKNRSINISEYFDSALKTLKTRNYPGLIKGVRGTSNEEHVVEHLVKGILRAMYGLYVNKDGTVRYDMTETAITHFKPREIGTSIEKLKEIGYEKDIYGNDLIDDEQILEIQIQDVILPSCDETPDEKADGILFNVTNFIDELLIKLYNEEKFYNLKSKKDLVGHLVVGMSPHTSAGVVGRIIGFSNTQGFYCHPYFHSLMRRDCDGDEACVILLMDALLNFSRKYIPGHRGAKQDEPLVLSSYLIPSEVDDMVFDMDIVDKYPLEFYLGAMEYKYPWDFKIKTVKSVLGTDDETSGFMFTHNTSDINLGVVCSSYKSIPTMLEKVEGQMRVAEKIRAVDENDVARLIIERHFIRDIKGNLRKFGMQQFRCVDCNEKYRRPPLSGQCKCGGRLIFTISEGSIVKYLEPSLFLAERYSLPNYLKQTLELTKQRIESVFGKDKEKQKGLIDWFGRK